MLNLTLLFSRVCFSVLSIVVTTLEEERVGIYASLTFFSLACVIVFPPDPPPPHSTV